MIWPPSEVSAGSTSPVDSVRDLGSPSCAGCRLASEMLRARGFNTALDKGNRVSDITPGMCANALHRSVLSFISLGRVLLRSWDQRRYVETHGRSGCLLLIGSVRPRSSSNTISPDMPSPTRFGSSERRGRSSALSYRSQRCRPLCRLSCPGRCNWWSSQLLRRCSVRPSMWSRPACASACGPWKKSAGRPAPWGLFSSACHTCSCIFRWSRAPSIAGMRRKRSAGQARCPAPPPTLGQLAPHAFASG